MAKKNNVFGLASTKRVNIERRIFDTSSAVAPTVIARAASLWVYPYLVIIRGKRELKVKSLAKTKLIPRQVLIKARSFIRSISTTSENFHLKPIEKCLK